MPNNPVNKLSNLVESARLGNRASIEELASFFYNKIFRMVYSRTVPRMDAEDLTQEIFLAMSKKEREVFALVAVGMAKGPAFGEEGGSHKKDSIAIPLGKWWQRPKVAEKIGITEEDKEKLDNMFYQHRYEMIDLHSRVQKERLELEKLLDRKNFDAKASIDQFANLQKANNTRAAKRFRFLVQVRELLGLDRFQQLKEQVRKYRMEKRHEKRKLTK